MIKAYFEGIETQILEEISVAKKSIKIAVAWFTNQEIFEKIR
ncbi:MAG: hypothetical protein AB8G86_14055 [Saprospiraceae bacterium]